MSNPYSISIFTVETWTEDRARFTIGVAGTFCSPLTTYIYARGLTCFPSFSPAFSTPAWQFLGILTAIVAVATLALITMEWFCPIKSTSKKNERISSFLFFFCKRTNKIWLWDLSDRPLGKQPSKFWILLTFFLLRKKIIIRWSSRHTVMNLLCKSWICWWF